MVCHLLASMVLHQAAVLLVDSVQTSLAAVFSRPVPRAFVSGGWTLRMARLPHPCPCRDERWEVVTPISLH